jgi:hypothetical protein
MFTSNIVHNLHTLTHSCKFAVKNHCKACVLADFHCIRVYLLKDEMSLKTLPLLFINLGGEMMYILDQRLRAQNIPQEKAKKGACVWIFIDFLLCWFTG